MISLQDYINEKRKELENISRPRSQRADLLGQLYEFYEKDYKVQTWKSYIVWLKQNKYKHSKDKVEQYKKVAYPKITIKSFCSYWLAPYKEDTLWYLLSIAKDKEHRNESFNRWLFWAIKDDKGKVTNT